MPKPKRSTQEKMHYIGLRLESDLYEKVQLDAVANGRSVGAELRQKLRQAYFKTFFFRRGV